jgi:ribosomal protein L16 Arg81 hydroxylase
MRGSKLPRMDKPIFDLGRLLEPIERTGFFGRYWEREVLHLSRSNVSYYDDVLSTHDLEQLIQSPLARYPAIQLSKGGAYFPPEVYSEDLKSGTSTFTGVPDVQKIAAEYRAGATVVLPALHRFWTPLRNLCAGIEQELDHVVHANAYLTPGNTSGFTPHYDTHEVLVLQIAGTKHWRIYEPPVVLPHRRQPFNPIGYSLPSKPLLEVDLGPGDLLYLPRGHVHTTTTSASYSAHVTIGIAVYTWLDLAGELLQAGMTSARLRQALPPGFAHRPELLPALKEDLEGALDELRDSAPGERLIEMLVARVRSGKVAERGTFRADVVVIAADTLLECPAPTDFRVGRQGTKVTLEFRQRRVVLPGEALQTLEYMRTKRTFRAMDLPGTLDIESKLTLLRLLHERDFLVVAL